MPIKLEDARVALEEIDSLELAMTLDIEAQRRQSHRGRLAQEHRIAAGLQAAAVRAKRARDAIEEQPGGGLREYDERRLALLAYFERFPEAEIQSDPLIVAEEALYSSADRAALDEPPPAKGSSKQARFERRERRARMDEYVLAGQDFSGEEHYGRYFDLHDCHRAWTNLEASLSDVSYLDYLSKIRDFTAIPDRTLDAYHEYLINLVLYLEGFERRAYPLSAVNVLDVGVVLKSAQSALDLESLGHEKLKQALEERGLKTGGTLAQCAERLFTVKGLSVSEFPARLRAASAKSGTDKLEKRAASLLERLDTILASTKSMVSKKLTMTYEEIAAEILEEELEAERGEESGHEDDDEDDDEAKMNEVSFSPLSFLRSRCRLLFLRIALSLSLSCILPQ